jgi:signal transduction histidine kinase/DNA-binding NarL/FixJ family response regulator
MPTSAPEALAVAVYAPVGRDGALTCALLGREGIACREYASLAAVCSDDLESFGALLLTEEALDHAHIEMLIEALAAQPGWSDIAVLLFAGGELTGGAAYRRRGLGGLTNVTVVERPVRAAALVSLVRAAQRARARQFQMRDLLASLHAAREQAERASRLKDEFLATLSHELRTPLNAILGWTALLRQHAVEPDRIPRVLDIVERNALAQAQLVSDVLDVSRMVAGKIRLNPTPMSVAAAVKDAIDTVKPAADARGVALEFADPNDSLVITGDAERIRQVVWNLLSNAVKFTPHGGRVTVAAARAGGFVEVTVADTGVGLTPEFLPFVFDRFRQADQSFTRTHGGLGIGLSIVKQVVEMHGGQVSAASEGAGRGAVFTVRLPIAAVDGAPADDAAANEGSPAGAPIDLSTRMILVLDDDGGTRELLTTILTRAGAIVTTASSAEEAMTAIDARVPDLIVADIGMPVEDGLSFCRRLRNRDVHQGANVPSIALSAYTRAEDRAAALAAGFDAFVAKPATPADLFSAIADVRQKAAPSLEGQRSDADSSVRATRAPAAAASSGKVR